MLPFLRNRLEGAASSDIESKVREPDDEGHESLLLICEELIHAVHAKDVRGTAEALKAAFELCDSEPHEEGSHTNA